MPAIVVSLWLYGHTSAILLSKYLIGDRNGSDRKTSLMLIQIWSTAELVCGLIDFYVARHWKREQLGNITSSISDGILYDPNEPHLTTRSHATMASPPSFGVTAAGAAHQITAATQLPQRPTHSSDDDFEGASYGSGYSMTSSLFEDVPIKLSTEESFAPEKSLDINPCCPIALRDLPLAKCCCRCGICCCCSEKHTHAINLSDIEKDFHNGTRHAQHNNSSCDTLDQAGTFRWKWFLWVVHGWLEVIAFCYTMVALKQTFVGDCQTHRYWTIVFIALMQMFLDEETLNHSVIGLGLIILGLSAKVLLGAITTHHPTIMPPRLGEGSRYVERPAGSYYALLAGILHSLQMFLHELSIELVPNSSGYRSIVPEAAGALYLCWSLYPFLLEVQVANIREGLANLREDWALTLWFGTSSLIAVSATLLQRRFSSPFARSVAFILQLPIVYFMETVILRWHTWRVTDILVIFVFLLGFTTMTATWPTNILGSHVHGFFYSTCFVKPRFMITIDGAFQNFISAFRESLKPIRPSKTPIRAAGPCNI